ncbi:DUF6504 family protein [Longilinea arvoryzae]|nr:DUF6504 family protein [Longilinea arvoryzae]
MNDHPLHFIDEPIEVRYDQPPLLEKKPDCPQGFCWRGEDLRIIEMLAEWQDFRRRGRMSRNMIPAHLQHASRAGSWGVGRFFFRVRVQDGRIFDIYYDRAPEDSLHRKGNWFVFSERDKSDQ